MIQYLSKGFDSFYELIWVFLIYGFAGWCSEVAFAALKEGKFVNRGFLNGAICPIYGVGMAFVVAVLSPIKNIFILFFVSLILTSSIELFVGFILEKLFHQKWWDYTGEPFNIKGYVCLRFSILWGFACTFVMRLVHPYVRKVIALVPFKIGLIAEIMLFATFVVDLIITVKDILKINSNLEILDQIDERLDEISNLIGENIYEGVTIAKKGSIEAKEYLEKEREELNEKNRKLLEYTSKKAKRLINAFPQIRSISHEGAMEKVKASMERLHNAKKKIIEKMK